MSGQAILLILLVIGLFAGILSGVPVMLAIAGVPLLIGLIGAAFGSFDLAFIQAYPQRVFGLMSNSLLIAVPLFILMGVLLDQSKMAERMLVVMSRFFGGSRSGIAYAVVVVSALLAASTGIIGATIVMLGVIALPAMLNTGLSPRLSSGLICASGTLGQIIPPSIVLILLGDQISNAYLEGQRAAGNFAPDQVSVGDLFAGALLPGLVLVGLYLAYIFILARSGRLQAKPGAPQEESAPAHQAVADDFGIGAALMAFLPAILLILAVLGSILMGIATPTEAAAVGAVGAVYLAALNSAGISALLHRTLAFGLVSAACLVGLKVAGLTRMDFGSIGQGVGAGPVLAIILSAVFAVTLVLAGLRLARTGLLQRAATETVLMTGMVFGIILAASLLSVVVRGLGGDELIEDLLTGLPGGQWGALAIVMLVIFLLGFILEFVEIIFVVIPIVGPVLLSGDLHPVWFAVLIAMNLQTSFLTPPFGFALFYYRGVAPDWISTVEIYRSIVPFVAIQGIAMLLLITFPGLATWLPSLLFR